MVVWFTTTCAISAYHHKSCEFESYPWRGVLDATLRDKVCQWLAAGRWFSPATLVSSTNKYNWNIVESDIKHHKPNKIITLTLIKTHDACRSTLLCEPYICDHMWQSHYVYGWLLFLISYPHPLPCFFAIHFLTTNILFIVMSYTFHSSLTFQILCKTVKYIDQWDNSYWRVLSFDT
jgi:hypothetical protein